MKPKYYTIIFDGELVYIVKRGNIIHYHRDGIWVRDLFNFLEWQEPFTILSPEIFPKSDFTPIPTTEHEMKYLDTLPPI